MREMGRDTSFGMDQVEPTTKPLLLCGRFFPFDEEGIPFAGAQLVIKERTNQSSECADDGGTANNVWDGALLLARYLEKDPSSVKDKVVLELGAGSGLLGIACAALGASRVIMTDLPYAIPLMKDNIKRNSSLIRNEISCKECDWFEPPQLGDLLDLPENIAKETEVVILVADCIWLAHLIPPLLRTLDKFAHARTKVIITYQQRGREAHDELWKGMQKLFDVTSIDTESSVGLPKPDVFYLLECKLRPTS